MTPSVFDKFILQAIQTIFQHCLPKPFSTPCALIELVLSEHLMEECFDVSNRFSEV
mgnify:CR=1 FL=1